MFSTFTIQLDILEDYMDFRGFKYCRLDGNMDLEKRKDNIERFNTNDDIFVFLLSTRAGGLGINLTAADTVIFYDRDWVICRIFNIFFYLVIFFQNPQMDKQAQDRCHRFGQTKAVLVLTLVSKYTIDEKIIEFGKMKNTLEKLVIRDGEFQFENKLFKKQQNLTASEIKHLLNEINQTTDNAVILSEINFQSLLDRSELFVE